MKLQTATGKDRTAEPRVVDTRTMAGLVDGSESWFYKNRDRIPGVRRLGRALRWDVEVVLEWMKTNAEVR